MLVETTFNGDGRHGGLSLRVPSEVLIRVVAFTQALEQWSLERELRKRLKGALDRAGIEIPPPAIKVVYENPLEDKEE
ncbi:MAG: hypothetical protein ACOYI6_11635 [Christensenellales bacterium]